MSEIDNNFKRTSPMFTTFDVLDIAVRSGREGGVPENRRAVYSDVAVTCGFAYNLMNRIEA